jgi:polyisoprenyl-phosphate glycosyltransferase
MKDSSSPHLSIVVPVYGSQDVLGELYERVRTTVEKITPQFELILVNDASPDNAWVAIKALAAQDVRVRGLNLSRNFGQYPAITAGLQASKGEWIVVMDCDLQDQPEEIEKMYEKAQEGFFVVVGSRQKRHDGFLRRLLSAAFYATLSYLSGTRQDGSVANFGVYHRRVIDAILAIEDHMRYFSVMVRWVGFRTATVPIEHASRKGGKSGYSIYKLLGLATNIILAYSNGPLRFIVTCGVVITAVASVYLVVYLGGALFFGHSNPLALLLGSLWFVFGALSTMIGIVALYLGKTFDEVKKRPIYLVQEEV